ncbi:MAG: prenyltransferase/squalene oxidase repeat-containing protein [Planctomycetota bacterium]|jgi:hypothetical protein
MEKMDTVSRSELREKYARPEEPHDDGGCFNLPGALKGFSGLAFSGLLHALMLFLATCLVLGGTGAMRELAEDVWETVFVNPVISEPEVEPLEIIEKPKLPAPGIPKTFERRADALQEEKEMLERRISNAEKAGPAGAGPSGLFYGLGSGSAGMPGGGGRGSGSGRIMLHPLAVFSPDHALSGAVSEAAEDSGEGNDENDGAEGNVTEKSIYAALKWLRNHQDENGAWDTNGFQKNCKGGKCSHEYCTPPAESFDAGVTGLALLAFLENGHTHQRGGFGKTVRRGLEYLLSVQDAQGRFGNTSGESWTYNHAIATQAACRAYAMTRDSRLRAPAQKAAAYIINAQNPGYGWKYLPRDGKNDSSTTGWMVLALLAAREAKIAVPNTSFAGAITWFDRVTRVSDGRTGYMRPSNESHYCCCCSCKSCCRKWCSCREHRSHCCSMHGRCGWCFTYMPAMTGIAITCKRLCGLQQVDKKIAQGTKIIMWNLPDYNKPKLNKVNFYYWYFGTRAMNLAGGENAKKWNEAAKKALLENQCGDGKCSAGSWDPIGKWCVVGGRVYATAIAAMTLREVCDGGGNPPENDKVP